MGRRQRQMCIRGRAPGSLRGKSGKKSGGQAGHRGDTLRQKAKPDFVNRHEAVSCGACQYGLLAGMIKGCLLYTSDAADDLLSVDLGGRRIIKKKKKKIF